MGRSNVVLNNNICKPAAVYNVCHANPSRKRKRDHRACGWVGKVHPPATPQARCWSLLQLLGVCTSGPSAGRCQVGRRQHQPALATTVLATRQHDPQRLWHSRHVAGPTLLSTILSGDIPYEGPCIQCARKLWAAAGHIGVRFCAAAAAGPGGLLP